MLNFHKSKQSAAVLKHAIIDSYATPFGSKTGSRSPGRRVAFIDGYAGPGRYESGDEGSGAMLLRKANELRRLNPPRDPECHFVENDPVTIERLRATAAAEAGDVRYSITGDDIAIRLPQLLEQLTSVPVFVYLDPCGLPIPMNRVAEIFTRSNRGSAATEVLINLTAHLRRFGGILTSPAPIEASLQRMDEVCGGRWWRDAWLEHCPTAAGTEDEKMAAERAVVEGYADTLREKTGTGTWIVDVRPRAGLKPVYYLIFATRHVAGLVTFGESASKGLERWRRYHAEHSAEDDLFGAAEAWEESWKADEQRLAEHWIQTLAHRLAAELAKKQPFAIIDRSREILGDDLAGVVRGTHLRSAIKRVLGDGLTTTDPKGESDLYSLVLRPT